MAEERMQKRMQERMMPGYIPSVSLAQTDAINPTTNVLFNTKVTQVTKVVTFAC